MVHCLTQIASLEEKPQGIKQELKKLEQSVYAWQVKIYDLEMEILEEEEHLLKKQLEVLKQEQQGKWTTYNQGCQGAGHKVTLEGGGGVCIFDSC